MTKIRNLFDSRKSDEEVPDLHPEQVKFEQEIKQNIPVLVGLIETAHTNMTNEINRRHPEYLNHLSKSIRMHEQIKGLLFDTYGDQIKKLSYNRFGLFISNYVFLFKKLDNAGRPSNVKTNNSEMLVTQSKLNFPGQPIIVHVGYVVDRTWEQLKRIYAVQIVEKQIEWISNLRVLVNGYITQVTNPAVTAVPDDADLTVQPKSKKKDIEGS
ncbi:hypothetical protein ACFQ3S_16105 [Mucilaginibacter terrae]|uniref:hypothetical protein n=1 Tax=Mucilaginibacter terrae TaxID=1955052 RepID=UPI00362DA218